MHIPRRVLVVCMFVLLAIPGSAAAGDRSSGPGRSSPGGSLLGTWYSEKGTAVFKMNGTMVFNGQNYSYTASKGIITLTGIDGTIPVSYQVSGGKLTTALNDGTVTVFSRKQDPSGEARKAGAGPGPKDLAGKWCYMSNVHASNGGRMSNRCFTLNPNGSYEYYGEASSSGQYGSAASQESDRGTWSATGTTLIANSARYGKRTYRLEKKNHPKTKDPMLVIEGEAYVTFYKKASW